MDRRIQMGAVCMLFLAAGCPGEQVAPQFSVGGTVKGLKGAGLALKLNGGAPLAVAADGSFRFPEQLADGAQYSVSVGAQPASPTQTCAVAAGTGKVAGADVTNVEVTCVTELYTLGGEVTGLLGSGLTLRNNGGADLIISAPGSFAFPGSVESGSTYAVEVVQQPTNPSQTCVVMGGSGTVVSGAVTSIAVNCSTDHFTISGTIAGLAGTGLVLQNNGGDDLSVNANGTFAFATAVPSASEYAVTVKSQPTAPWQTCTVTNGNGTVGGGNVTSVAVECTTNTYAVGGTVVGLEGTGLVLQNNGGDDLEITADGLFTFATEVESGAPYEVTVSAQPQSPSQTCVVSGGAGTMGSGDVFAVTVNCTINEYVVGGTVTGLAGSGLTLALNGGAPLPVSSNGSFAFPTTVPSEQGYAVTLETQPTAPWQTCTLTNDTGTVTNADITDVTVTCVSNQYPLEVTVTGLSGSGLVLQNNAADDLTITADGTWEFVTPVTSGTTYLVTALTQPSGPSQTCTVASPSGTVGGATVSLAVTCTTNTYPVGGTVSGLNGMGLVLQNNGADDLSISANGSFAFATQVASGDAYLVTVKTQPTGQYCTLSNASGTVVSSPVTSVAVTCVNAFTSCQAARQADPTLPNGTYPIDADGPGPLPLVSAYCDMTSGGHTVYATTHDWGEWGSNMTIVIRDRLTPAVGSISDWQASCALFGKVNYSGSWKNTGQTYSLPQYAVYADAAAWWNNHARQVFPSITYNDFVILQDTQSTGCWAHYAEVGSLQAFGSPTGAGYAFCRGGNVASKRYHIYLCLP